MATLYKFQKQAVAELMVGKHIVVAGCGCGKTAMSLTWLAEMQKKTGKKKVCIWTTASKAHTTDWQDEADIFAPSLSKSQSLLSVISWHKASEWVSQHWGEVGEYLFVFDEIQRSKAGVSSLMGKAFLKVTKATDAWIGMSATPGQNWLDFYPYYQACGLVRNKTQFKFKYAIEQTFKGYPEIIGWRNEKELLNMWKSISYTPDTAQVFAEMPEETNKTVVFKKPTTYDKTKRTRVNSEGEFMDTTMALMVELRRLCFTKEKKQWLADFLENLGTGAVLFYNFIKTGDEIEQIAKKALPKGAKIWRIDGKNHEIPSEDTIGKYDIVLCQWQSGSEALNLQFLNYWVAVELCYSYATFLQAKGRIKRIGQKKPMFFYRLVCDNCIERKIVECLAKKKDFVEDSYIREEGLDGE